MTTAIEVPREQSRVELVALDKPQLEVAHGQMLDWTRNQIAAMRDELLEAEETLAVARTYRWATDRYERRISIAKRRVVFYEKLEAALVAGFVIVPNFPMNVFAIRTKRELPKGVVTERSWGTEDFVQSADLLPLGEGEYQNPLPSVERQNETKQLPGTTGATKQVTLSWPVEFRDIAFPIALAKPALMSKTGEAMAMKLFDEIGVAEDHDTRRSGSSRGDPILLGRLRNPRKNAPAMTFFLGWYFDPSRV